MELQDKTHIFQIVEFSVVLPVGWALKTSKACRRNLDETLKSLWSKQHQFDVGLDDNLIAIYIYQKMRGAIYKKKGVDEKV